MRILISAGLSLIKSFEGCKLTSYRCPAGIWTIGWGHTGPYVGEGLTITQSQADTLLMRDLVEFQTIVEDAVKVPLNDNQFGALCSFVFNVGPGKTGKRDGFVHLSSGQPSSMLRYINEKSYASAAAEFPKWNRVGGQESAGLTCRRLAEQNLFLSKEMAS